jgi:hypothetical protein
MALTFSVIDAEPGTQKGGRRFHVVDITTDNAYAAGGYALTAANLGFDQRIIHVAPAGAALAAGFIPVFVRATGKLMYQKTGAGLSGPLAEAGANEATLNGVITTVYAIGY